MLYDLYDFVKKRRNLILEEFIRTLGFEIKRIENDDALYYKLFPKDSLINKRFYNIGAAGFNHKFWTNIDMKSYWYQREQKNSNFINFDLSSLKNLPIYSNTAEIVYSSHTIEHINDTATQNMFNEAYRILKNNSILRICVPNIDLVYMAYKNNDKNFFDWVYKYPAITLKECNIKRITENTSIKQIFLFFFAGHVSELFLASSLSKISDEELDEIFDKYNYEDALNYCIKKCTSEYSIELSRKYPGIHINWWNEKKLIKMIREAGFKKVYKSGYGQSASPVLRNLNLFDSKPKISLYVEAIKI